MSEPQGEPEELETCHFCNKTKENVIQRTYKVKTGKIGRITSISQMCDECFSNVKDMVK